MVQSDEVRSEQLGTSVFVREIHAERLHRVACPMILGVGAISLSIWLVANTSPPIRRHLVSATTDKIDTKQKKPAAHHV